MGQKEFCVMKKRGRSDRGLYKRFKKLVKQAVLAQAAKGIMECISILQITYVV